MKYSESYDDKSLSSILFMVLFSTIEIRDVLKRKNGDFREMATCEREVTECNAFSHSTINYS